MPEAKSKTPRAPRLVLDVTEEIIHGSIERHPSNCMFAQAIRAKYPDAERIDADLQTMRFSDLKRGYRYVYVTPRTAQEAIILFDQGIKPAPFRLRLVGGQVHLAGRRPSMRQLTDKERAQRKAASEARTTRDAGVREALRQGQLVPRKGSSKDEEPADHSTVFERIGGKTPPLSVPRRRVFGLKGFDRIR